MTEEERLKRNAYHREYRRKNAQKIREAQKRYDQEHKEERRQYKKEYSAKNRDKIAESRREYLTNYRKTVLAHGTARREAENKRSLEYYHENREKVAAKKKEKLASRTPEQKEKAAMKRKESRANRTPEQIEKDRETKRASVARQRQTDPCYRVLRNIRNAVSKELLGVRKDHAGPKDGYCKYVGCSKETLKTHIESLFKDGMSWENHGKVWHLDHIVPISLGKKDFTLLLKLSHYKNLQPLFAVENIRKGDSLPEVWPEGVPFTRSDFGL